MLKEKYDVKCTLTHRCIFLYYIKIKIKMYILGKKVGPSHPIYFLQNQTIKCRSIPLHSIPSFFTKSHIGLMRFILTKGSTNGSH